MYTQTPATCADMYKYMYLYTLILIYDNRGSFIGLFCKRDL